MKFAVAFVLVVVSMVNADIPRQRVTVARQTAQSAPYVAKGWRPNGPQFNLPLKAQPQQVYGPPEPAPEEAETATTEAVSTTESTTEEGDSQLAENLEDGPKSGKLEKLDEPAKGGQYYVVLPQQQNLLYTVPQSAALVVPRANLVAAPLPFSSSVFSSTYTPYGASYVQIYQ